MEENYSLRYSPLFYNDVDKTISYLCEKLQNQQAASDLLDDIERAILSRLPHCESFEPYQSSKYRKNPYYRIYVKNYIIFYVVIRSKASRPVMEVRRFLYVGQDRESII